jgi:hypothetical protein
MHIRLCARVLFPLGLLALLALRSAASPPASPERVADTRQETESYLYRLLGENGVISDSRLPFVIYVQGVKGRTLIWPVVKHRDAQGEIDFIMHARDGELRVDAAGNLILRMRRGTIAGRDGSRAEFADRTWEVRLPAGFGED